MDLMGLRWLEANIDDAILAENIELSSEYFVEGSSMNLEVLKDIFESNSLLSESFFQNLIKEKIVSIKPF